MSTTLYQQMTLVNAYKEAIRSLRIQAQEVQKLTHEAHIRDHFSNAIDTLTMHLDCEAALLIRVQTVGR